MQQLLKNLPKEEVLRYLGYRGTELPQKLSELIDECIHTTLNTITPRYLYRCFPLTKTDSGIQVGDTPLVLPGKDIQDHLFSCESVYLLCVTLGLPIDRLIRLKMVSAPDEGVIYDSCASTAVEALADLVQKEIEKEISATGKNLTWRFSPGYGDLPLTIQRELLDVMDCPRKIGLSLNESLLLTPTKSVTAILGVSDTRADKRENKCDYCNNRANCAFRKRGTQC